MVQVGSKILNDGKKENLIYYMRLSTVDNVIINKGDILECSKHVLKMIHIGLLQDIFSLPKCSFSYVRHTFCQSWISVETCVKGCMHLAIYEWTTVNVFEGNFLLLNAWQLSLNFCHLYMHYYKQ